MLCFGLGIRTSKFLPKELTENSVLGNPQDLHYDCVEDACKSQGKRGTDLMNKCRMRFNFLSVGFLLSALCGNSIYKSSVHVAVCF